MKSTAAVPYLLPPDLSVSATGWLYPDGTPLPERFEHWDPQTNLELGREVAVDTDLVRETCRLGSDARFALTSVWHGSSTRLSGGPAPLELADLSGPVAADLTLTVPGDRVGGRVELVTRLVLRHPGESTTPISPSLPGTTLWVDRHRVAVEGTAARFPVTATDFAATAFASDAGWALDWDTHDLNAPLLGAMRLLVNANQPALLAALQTGSADPRSTATRSFITYDVARTMLDAVLRSEDFLAGAFSFDEGTVGRAAADLLTAVLPGVSPRTAAALAAENPSRLSAAIQAHLGATA